MNIPSARPWAICNALLRSITEEWDKAERDIKLAEQISGKVVLPSINELRYAGRRVVEVIKLIGSEGDIIEIEAKLRDARFDCHRARHDAIDAGTAKIAADLEIMSKKLGYGPILKVFPALGQLHRDLDHVRSQIAASRNNTENRAQIYEELEDDAFPKIVTSFRALQSNEQIIRGYARGERRHTLLLTFVGIIELIVAIGLVIEGAHWLGEETHLIETPAASRAASAQAGHANAQPPTPPPAPLP